MGSSGKRTAIVYDFDGTLARGNIQEHTFLPELGIEKEEFWAEVGALKQKHDADQILIYMQLMLERARERQIDVTREALVEHGKRTPLFEGLDRWFDRIDEFAASRNLDLEHYVISAGTEEMIQGAACYSKFKKVFASRFMYDANGVATWPALAINYTTKTQYLFRINKGVDNSWDNEPVNRWVPMKERPVPFSRMIFIGDGDTDIPCMKMVRHQGGYSIAVYDPGRPVDGARKIYDLIAEDRVHYVAPADYTEDSLLDITVKGVLGRMGREEAGYRSTNK